jgi:hypothetical protein
MIGQDILHLSLALSAGVAVFSGSAALNKRPSSNNW